MTTRSFLKRLHALIRYRQALKHMAQYPDATAEELGREDTCIICREEMRPWDTADAMQVERSRAKKLPCGHILHFGCLKSWLERQQVCPTCRRPVTRDGQQPAANGPGGVVLRLGFPAGQNQQPQPPANGQAAPGGGQHAQGGAAGDQGNNQNRNVRMFNLGPLRVGFAQGGVEEFRDMAQRMQAPADAVNPPAPTPTVPTPQENNNHPTPGLDQLRGQLLALGNQVRQDMINVHNAAHEVHVLSVLMNELIRLRQLQQQPPGQLPAAPQAAPQGVPGTVQGVQAQITRLQQLQQQQQPEQLQHGLVHPFMYPPAQGQPPFSHLPYPLAARPQPTVTRHVSAGHGTAIPAGSADLPEGVVIPPGWSLLPLQRLEGEIPPSEPMHNAQAPAQDMFRSVFASHPRSRGTSPAPGSHLSGQLGRPPTSNMPEPSRRPGSQGATLPDTAARRQPPVVTAPIPLAPNWGGRAQFFGGDRTVGPFGYQAETGENNSSNGATAAAAEVNGVAAESRGGQQAEETEGNGGSSDRAPRAATVEEAQDDDEER